MDTKQKKALNTNVDHVTEKNRVSVEDGADTLKEYKKRHEEDAMRAEYSWEELHHLMGRQKWKKAYVNKRSSSTLPGSFNWL